MDDFVTHLTEPLREALNALQAQKPLPVNVFRGLERNVSNILIPLLKENINQVRVPSEAMALIAKETHQAAHGASRAPGLAGMVSFSKHFLRHARIDKSPIKMDSRRIKSLEIALTGVSYLEHDDNDIFGTTSRNAMSRVQDIDALHNEIASLGCNVEKIRTMAINTDAWSAEARKNKSLPPALVPPKVGEQLMEAVPAVTPKTRKWQQFLTHTSEGNFSALRTTAFAAGATAAIGAIYVLTHNRNRAEETPAR